MLQKTYTGCYLPPWHAWMMKTLGLPDRAWQWLPSNMVVIFSIEIVLPSAPKMSPFAPWLRMHRKKAFAEGCWRLLSSSSLSPISYKPTKQEYTSTCTQRSCRYTHTHKPKQILIGIVLWQSNMYNIYQYHSCAILQHVAAPDKIREYLQLTDTNLQS